MTPIQTKDNEWVEWDASVVRTLDADGTVLRFAPYDENLVGVIQRMADAYSEVASAAAVVADQIEEAVAVRDTLALLVVTPVAERKPEDTALAMQAGAMLTLQSVDSEDDEINRLRSESTALAVAALLPRLSGLFGGG